jgi:hypothetical protein
VQRVASAVQLRLSLQPTEQMLSPSTFADQFQPPPTLSREKVIAEGLTAAQAHILIGDILEKMTLRKDTHAAPHVALSKAE